MSQSLPLTNVRRSALKRCYACGVLQGVENFRRHIRRADGLRDDCRPCHQRSKKTNPCRAHRNRGKKASRSWQR